jgi:uncharacterized protein YjiS (DUF1127 family)
MIGSATIRSSFPAGIKEAAEPDRRPDGPANPGSPIDRWRKRLRFRRHLARLLATNAGLIEDIGLTPHEAEIEVSRPFRRF